MSESTASKILKKDGQTNSRSTGSKVTNKKDNSTFRAPAHVRGTSAKDTKASVQQLFVFDAAGVDVTPRSLLDAKFKKEDNKYANVDLINAITSVGKGHQSFMKNTIFQSYASSDHTTDHNDHTRSNHYGANFGEAEVQTDRILMATGLLDVQTVRKSNVQEELSEKELDIPHEIILQESEIFWMLDIPNTWVLPDTEEEAATIAEIQKHQEQKKKSLCVPRPVRFSKYPDDQSCV